MRVVETVNEWIGARRLQWYYHCKKMSHQLWPRTVLEKKGQTEDDLGLGEWPPFTERLLKVNY